MAFELITAHNGVKYYRSTLIKSKHGFSTRVGGVSALAHTSSLNLAFGRGDGDETVLQNIKLFCDAVGIRARDVISHPQIHSSRVMHVDTANRGEGYFIKNDDGCDGYVTGCKDVALGVKTADCVPIILEDADAQVVGAVHAGWRGTAANIVNECVSLMISLGAKPARIHAAIGAAIHQCCYEVGDDFFSSVASFMGELTAKRFIKSVEGRLHADIVGMNEQLLLDAGLSVENIDVCEMCTCCHPELFFSHRYSGGVRGTMLSVIELGL